LLIGSFASLARGQADGASGTVAGRVVDSATAAPVAGATVLVESTLLRAITDDRGAFRIRGLAPGRYAVRVAAIGFESRIAHDVVVTAGGMTRADVALRHAVVQLSEVAVTASGAAERPGDAPASEAVMSRSEIVSRNVLTVDQALTYVPGVIFNNGSLDIRGSTGVAGGIGSRVMVMLDGHPVLSGDGEAVDFSTLPLLDVERLEVVKGGYSALYGSNALGGVVNVITRPIGDQPSTAVDLHYGHYYVPGRYRFTDHGLGYDGLELERSQRLSPTIAARLSLDREFNSGYEQDNGSDRWLGYTRVDADPEGRHPGSFYAIYKWEKDGNFLGWLDAHHPYQVPPSQLNDRSVAARVSLGGTLSPVAGASRRVELNPYLDYNLDRDTFPSDTVNPSKYHRSTRVGTRGQWSILPGGSHHSLVLGADVAGTFVESDELSNHQLGDAGVYVQDQAPLGRRAAVVGGLRYDWHDVAGASAQGSVSPKLGVVVHPTSDLSTRISIGHGYRAPSVIEEFTRAYEDGYNLVPNPSLRGETSWSAEVGATDHLTSWFWLDGAMYQTEYWGLIGPTLAGPPLPGSTLPPVQFRNVTRARIRGLDLAARATVVPRLVSTAVNYTLLDPEDLTARAWLPYRSRHNLTGSLDLLGGLCGVDLHFRSRVEQVLVYAADPRADITLFDLRLGYRVLGTLLQAKVVNVFQQQYVDVQERIPGQPRTIFLSALRYF